MLDLLQRLLEAGCAVVDADNSLLPPQERDRRLREARDRWTPVKMEAMRALGVEIPKEGDDA